MSKDNVVYIGSTPKHLTRIAKETNMRKNSENNRRLLESLGYYNHSNTHEKAPGGMVTVKKA
ncbi:hypothetical protein [Fredinandcohnia quinoae]|uniref:Uncharacterized protein n=1 Tax=Fredinandcohnia quinoae TaxID=2918902 RepID=A0AAW5E6L6_9BACI|nr:hypothetical protein [Fredinandcohnia sp. SECRCQ15]MCH1627134.1 hypothetical protein [Fredinandcohnia sp. SECRCQ15]